MPKTKLRLVSPKAVPTIIPRLIMLLSSFFNLGAKAISMIRVARQNPARTNSCGGIVLTPILVKRKLPPQKKVVRIRKKYTLPMGGGGAASPLIRDLIRFLRTAPPARRSLDPARSIPPGGGNRPGSKDNLQVSGSGGRYRHRKAARRSLTAGQPIHPRSDSTIRPSQSTVL